MMSTTEEQTLALALSQRRQELTRLLLNFHCGMLTEAAYHQQARAVQQQTDDLDRQLDAPERDSA